MLTDPTGTLSTAAKITSTYRSRSLLYALIVNWSKDTTDFVNGTWIDETRFLTSASGRNSILGAMDGLDSVGQVAPWNMDVTLINSSGRFSPSRIDGPLYTPVDYISGGKMMMIPVKLYVGFRDKPGGTPGPSTTLSSSISSTDTIVSLAAASFNNGTVVRCGTEDMLVISGGGTTTVKVIRGIIPTKGASHSSGATVSPVGAAVPQFVGMIISPRGSSGAFSISLECKDRGYLLLQQKVSTALLQNKYVNELIGLMLDLIPADKPYYAVPGGQRRLDPSSTVVPYTYSADEFLGAEISNISEVDLGRFFFSKDGYATFHSGLRWVIPNPSSPNLDPTIVQYEIDRLNMRDLTPSVPRPENIYSDVVVIFSPRMRTSYQTLFRLSEAKYLPRATASGALNGGITATASAIVVTVTTYANGDVFRIDNEQFQVTSGGGTVNLNVSRGFNGSVAAAHLNSAVLYKASVTTVEARMDFPVESYTMPVGGKKPGAKDPDKREYVAIFGIDSDRTEYVSIKSVDHKAEIMKLDFANSDDQHDLFLSRLMIRGWAIMGAPTERYSLSLATDPAGLPKRTKTFAENWNIQTQQHAENLGQMFLERARHVRNSWTIQQMWGNPLLECGDRIKVYDPPPGVLSSAKEGFVQEIRWSLLRDEQAFMQDIEMVEATGLVPYNDYFIVEGTAGSGQLGNSRRYAP